MKDLVEVIAKSLVDHPEEVVVNQTEESNAILVELKVAPSDGQGDWPSGTHRKGNPNSGKSCFL